MKRYYFIVLTTFILGVLCFSVTKVSARLPLSGKLIVIDPGHGGIGLIQNKL